ncbi:MAG: glycosyltransferase [Alphaproteobacteria bacterium]|nr:glycosyltransferase [Alphaproteobacteria bacterium]
MRIALLVRSLVSGGTERQVALLAAGLAARGHDCTILTFYAAPSAPSLPGVRIVHLGKRSRWDVAGFVLRLWRALRDSDPQVLYALLPIPNLLAVLARIGRPRLKIVLGLRASALELRRYDTLSRLAFYAEERLARWANAVIVNSEAGRRHARERGIPEELLTVVRNGVDLDRFRPTARAARASLTDNPGAVLVGMVARWDPMKDHRTFARALALVHDRAPEVAGIVAGDVPPPAREELTRLARGAPLRWRGWQDDMPALYAGLDLLCVPSAWGEGSSNAIAEAMACGIPCVATDIGDNAMLIGDTGRVAAPGDPQALAEAILEFAGMEPALRAELGRRARARIAALCSTDAMVENTLAVFAQLWCR